MLFLLQFHPSQLYLHSPISNSQAGINQTNGTTSKQDVVTTGKKEPRVKDLQILVVTSSGLTITVGTETLLLVHGSHDNLVITEATATFELDEDWAADEVTLTFRATFNSGKVGTGENRKSFKGTVFQGYDADNICLFHSQQRQSSSLTPTQ